MWGSFLEEVTLGWGVRVVGGREFPGEGQWLEAGGSSRQRSHLGQRAGGSMCVLSGSELPSFSDWSS